MGSSTYPLPQPISSGSVDLSSIKPVSSGSVSIADAIAKARGFAAERGVSYDSNRGISDHFRFCCKDADRYVTLKFPRETTILDDEVGAHAHPHEAPLVPFVIVFETITIPTVTNGAEAMIAATFGNVHFLHDPRTDFLLPRVAHMAYQTIEHRWSTDQVRATQNVSLSRRVL